MKLCWSSDTNRPNVTQIKGMLHHLLNNKSQADRTFEERWASLKPNSLALQAPGQELHHTVVIEHHDMIPSPNKGFPQPDKQQSPSLQNLHGSLEDFQELRSISLPASREVSPVKTFDRRRNSSVDLFSSQSSTLDDDDTRKICEAIQDLDDALALEQTSSSECSSIVCTPIRRHSITAKPEDTTLKADSDSEEEETWRGRIERGEFTEKVRIKSRSVQDLMVLTHIDSSSDGEDGDLPQPRLYKSEAFKSEGNICGAVVIEGLLDSFRKLRRLSKIEDNTYESLAPESISTVGVDFHLESSSPLASNKFLSNDLSKYLISDDSAALSVSDVQLETFDQPYSILNVAEDNTNTSRDEENSTLCDSVANEPLLSIANLEQDGNIGVQSFDTPLISLPVNTESPKLAETKSENVQSEVPIVVTDLAESETEITVVKVENVGETSLNLLQPPQKIHKSKQIQVAAAPAVSMIAYESPLSKHHRKIRDISKDLNFLQMKTRFQGTPSTETAGMIAFDSNVPPVSLYSPEEQKTTEVAEAAIVPTETPSLPVMLIVERKPLSSPEKEQKDGPLSTIAFEYVAEKQEALILDDVQSTFEPLYKPRKLTEMCEEVLVNDPKQYNESNMEAVILDVDTNTFEPDIIENKVESVESENSALNRLDNLINEKITAIDNWSTSAEMNFPTKRNSNDFDTIKTSLEEFSIKRTTPDDERSSDSGYRDKVSLSESCDGDAGEKYNLEDIEVELETFGNLGTPSSDSGLERTPHDDLKGFETTDSEEKIDDDDDFWKQQMASLKSATNKTMALFHEAVGADLSPSEEERAYTNSWFKRSLEDSEGSSDAENSGYGLDEASEAAIRSELQQKLPNLGGCSDGGEEEEIKQEDIPVHYNIYPAPLSPILEEQESLASSGSCSPSVSVATKVAARSKSLSSTCSNSPAPVETPPLVMDRSEQFEADIRAALESCSAGPSAPDDDDVLFINTETNVATLVESPLKPKLPFLNFVNGQQVYNSSQNASDIDDQWVEEEEQAESHEHVTKFDEEEEERTASSEGPMVWMSLPSTKAPMPSPEEEHSKLVGAELNDPQRQCVTPDWESDTGSDDSCSSGEFVWKVSVSMCISRVLDYLILINFHYTFAFCNIE